MSFLYRNWGSTNRYCFYPLAGQKRRIFLQIFFFFFKRNFYLIIADSCRTVLNSPDPIADIQEDLRNKVSGGEKEFAA